MKCSICNKTIEETFMKKIIGTNIKKPGSNKLYSICPECQKKFKTKDELLRNLK